MQVYYLAPKVDIERTKFICRSRWVHNMRELPANKRLSAPPSMRPPDPPIDHDQIRLLRLLSAGRCTCSTPEEYGGIEYGGLPVEYRVFGCCPTHLRMITTAPVVDEVD